MPPNPASAAAPAPPGPAALQPLLMVAEDHSEVSLKALDDAPPAPLAPPSRPEEKEEDGARHQIKWRNICIITGMHVALLYSLTWAPRFKWQTWLWNFLLAQFAGFGVTGGAHRLWTHRSFKATFPLRLIMMLGHGVAGMNSIYDWVRDHRVHHKFTETDADPHNARRGFFFSHVGWLMVKKHPEVTRRGQSVDMSDVIGDPVVSFQRKHHLELFYLLCFVMPTVVPVLWWDETWVCSAACCMTRWVLGVNAVWSVNSAAHLYGSHPFNKFISPADNKLVSFMCMGEGWHNYHHVFPWDYKASEYGFLNTTMHLIGLCQRLGWAYDLKTAPRSLVQRVATRYGDGSHPDWAEVPEAAAKDPSVLDMLPPPPRNLDHRRDKEA